MSLWLEHEEMEVAAVITVYGNSFGCALFCWWQSQFIALDKINTKASMMTSSNGNIFRVTGHLCGEFTGPRWIPRTKASDAELWCFLWSAPNNREAGDSRRYQAHCDVIVMLLYLYYCVCHYASAREFLSSDPIRKWIARLNSLHGTPLYRVYIPN